MLQEWPNFACLWVWNITGIYACFWNNCYTLHEILMVEYFILFCLGTGWGPNSRFPCFQKVWEKWVSTVSCVLTMFLLSALFCPWNESKWSKYSNCPHFSILLHAFTFSAGLTDTVKLKLCWLFRPSRVLGKWLLLVLCFMVFTFRL